MPMYDYQCEGCGERFVFRQAMSDEPLAECPECHGHLHRVVSGGVGFVLKGGRSRGTGPASCATGACSLERTGRTCCGMDGPCR